MENSPVLYLEDMARLLKIPTQELVEAILRYGYKRTREQIEVEFLEKMVKNGD